MLTAPAAFALVGAVVLAVVIERAFVAAHRVLGWAVACAVVALLLDAVAHWLDQRLPRMLAIVLSLIAMVGLVAITAFAVVRQLRDSLDTLSETAPEAAKRLEARLSFARDLQLAARVTSLFDSIDKRLHSTAIAQVGTAPTYAVTGILMLFYLAYGRRYLRGAFEQIEDPTRRQRVATVVTTGLARGRSALLWMLMQTIVVTLCADALFRALDLPADLVLGFVIGVLSVVPYLGVVLGGLPALLIAYGFHGFGTMIVVLVVLVVLQLAETLLWRRWLDSRTVYVGPFLTIAVAFIGFSIYGVGGAVYGFALTVLGVAAYDAATDNEPGDASRALTTRP